MHSCILYVCVCAHFLLQGVGGVCNFLGSVSSQQKFEVTALGWTSVTALRWTGVTALCFSCFI